MGVSRADILVPPCCFPFCCLAGREHIYSDTQLRKLIEIYAEHSRMFGAPDYEASPEHVIYKSYPEIVQAMKDRSQDPPDWNEKIKNKDILKWEMYAHLRAEMNIAEGVTWCQADV